jgi:hypothetical protein
MAIVAASNAMGDRLTSPVMDIAQRISPGGYRPVTLPSEGTI